MSSPGGVGSGAVLGESSTIMTLAAGECRATAAGRLADVLGAGLWVGRRVPQLVFQVCIWERELALQRGTCFK